MGLRQVMGEKRRALSSSLKPPHPTALIYDFDGTQVR